MTERNTDLFFAIAEQIERQPASYYQGTWGRRSACGTTACIAGWAVQLAAEVQPNCGYEPRWVKSTDGGGRDDLVVLRRGTRPGPWAVTVSEAARDLLDITYEEACHLFAGDWDASLDREEIPQYLRDIGKGVVPILPEDYDDDDGYDYDEDGRCECPDCRS